MSFFQRILFALITFILFPVLARAQLVVTVSTPQVTGQKAVVPLVTENKFAEKVQSARATVFLLDENGKMAGQTAQWIIGGNKNKPGLAAGATNFFNVVVTGSKPFVSTNLTAKISFNRILLESGRLADATKDVQIQKAVK